MMSENPIFSYTHRDYESSRQEGLSKIPILSKGQWTDLNATDPGVIILDYVHALVDLLNYYQDHQALETFLSTAKERESIFRIAKQLSYEIRSAKGAVCEVDFSTSNVTYLDTIRIPKYTNVSTLSGINYLTSEDAYLLAGQSEITIPCSQGTLSEHVYTGTGVSRFSNITGAKNQSVRLVDNNIDIDTISITDNTGREWTPVDYIAFATELDRVYQVDLNPDNSVTIKFGDGERGVVPKETDILTIRYISTAADQGRVSMNSLVVLVDAIYDKGRVINFNVNNRKASSGGTTVQSSQEIKELAPGAIKAQNRAVTLSDFESLAKLVDGVADARAYDINVKPDLCLYHEVKVLVTPSDVEGSIDNLKERVYNYLSKRMIPPTNLQVLTPSYIYINIEVTVKKLDNASEGRLSYEIQKTVENHFKNREGAIGEPFYPSDLITEISSLSDVRSIISMTPNDTYYAEDLSVIRLGNLSIHIR